MLRGHTPSRRGPAPSGLPACACAARACAACRGVLRPLPFAAARALHAVERLRGCARCRADQCRPAGVAAAGDGRPQPQRGARPGTPEPPGHAPHRGLPSARPLQTYRAAGWSARFAGAGCPAHLPCRWRDWAASAGRWAAPTFRVTEPCWRVPQWPRRRRGAGCDHLGGCRPLPHRRGGISLKEAGTSLFPAVRIGASCGVREKERVRPTWLRRPA